MIPPGKLRHYSPQHQDLRQARDQLRNALAAPHVNTELLSQLEATLVREAFEAVAAQGSEVLVTFDKDVYEQDQKSADETVYLLCDQDGHLQDINPLLSFVTSARREEYEAFRRNYLRSE
ncbi:hypothetical protein CL620_03665 [archaeon]|nr:hypothetical protein [archaeon]|tara:strand:- start:193 stop:552 length:360 start_codon:yes stop_codon:yes gene_type:complete